MTIDIAIFYNKKIMYFRCDCYGEYYKSLCLHTILNYYVIISQKTSTTSKTLVEIFYKYFSLLIFTNRNESPIVQV